MSHEATNWAIKQRGLKPATKIVLWHLADCHNPAGGCFPSQEYLADACEMSRSTVNVHLDLLEQAGLIRRIRSIDPRTKRQKPTEYILNIGASVSGNRTRPVSENRTRAVSGNDEKPCPDFDESRVRNPDTNLVREPVREPVKENAREFAREFEHIWSAYPRKVGKGRAEKEWAKARRLASFEEIAKPLAAFSAAIAGTETRFIPHLATWLHQRRWEDDQSHAANRARTSTDDLRRLSTVSATDDLERLFAAPQLRLVAQ